MSLHSSIKYTLIKSKFDETTILRDIVNYLYDNGIKLFPTELSTTKQNI